MNTYLMPCSDIDGPWIETVIANSYKHAIEKFCLRFYDNMEIDLCTDLDELEEELHKQGVLIGEIRDLSEFPQ